MATHIYNRSTWKVHTGGSKVKSSLCYKENSKLAWTENCLNKHSKPNQSINCLVHNLSRAVQISNAHIKRWVVTACFELTLCTGHAITSEHQLMLPERFLLLKTSVHCEVQYSYYTCQVSCIQTHSSS